MLGKYCGGSYLSGLNEEWDACALGDGEHRAHEEQSVTWSSQQLTVHGSTHHDFIGSPSSSLISCPVCGCCQALAAMHVLWLLVPGMRLWASDRAGMWCCRRLHPLGDCVQPAIRQTEWGKPLLPHKTRQHGWGNRRGRSKARSREDLGPSGWGEEGFPASNSVYKYSEETAPPSGGMKNLSRALQSPKEWICCQKGGVQCET